MWSINALVRSVVVAVMLVALWHVFQQTDLVNIRAPYPHAHVHH